MKKSIIILFISLLFFTLYSRAQTATAPSIGDGSSGSPYQIATLENLYWITATDGVVPSPDQATRWSSYFIQTADINASATSTWDSGAGWTPIGNFSGSYDGQGHTISGLTINRPEENSQGLFGRTSGGSIKNLGLNTVNITGNEEVGGLVGWNFISSSVTNCYSTGSITGGTYVGGLVGWNSGSSSVDNCYSTSSVAGTGTQVGGLVGLNWELSNVNNCYSTGSVIGDYYVGGLIGKNFESNVNNCYSTDSVSGSGNVGGLVGINSNSSSVNNCYGTGSVSGTSEVGGLVGWNNESQVTNCYSIGSVSCTYNVGGLVGYENSSTITNSFWDTETSGQTTSAGGTGKSTAEMQTFDIFFGAGWDMMIETTNGEDDFWGINDSENNGYPFLEWQGYSMQELPKVSTLNLTDITKTTATGNGCINILGDPPASEHGVCWGTSSNPTIAGSHTTEGSVTATGAFSSSITGLEIYTTYYLRAYATYDDGTAYGAELQFTTPLFVGAGTSGGPYQISNLDDLALLMNNSTHWDKYYIQTADIDASATSTWDSDAGWSPIGNSITSFTGSYNGQGHTISGLTINRSEENYQGLFGYTNGATIQNLGLNNVNISGYIGVGSLAGNILFSSSMNNCYSTGNVTGRTAVGGLVGENLFSSSMTNCYSTGSVTGTSYLGGLVGENLFSSSITNCYSTDSVSGDDYAGGLVGYNISNVTNCFSIGCVTGSSNVGGLIGVESSSTTTNSFWDTETSGQAISAGGTGKSTIEMLTLSTFTNAGWDFKGETPNGTDEIWNIGNGRNDGYPYFDWQFPLDKDIIPNVLELSDLLLLLDVDTCFNAYDTITVAGSDTVIFESGSSVTLIAGKSIIFLPGFHTCSGSFVDAHITSDSSFCDGSSGSPIVNLPVEKSLEVKPAPGKQDVVPGDKSIKVYPNPNNGQFIIALINIRSESAVAVYNMLGVRVYSSLVNEQAELNINLPELRKGIYFVKVTDQKEQFTKKMMVN
jgi:hypothetical protein